MKRSEAIPEPINAKFPKSRNKEKLHRAADIWETIKQQHPEAAIYSKEQTDKRWEEQQAIRNQKRPPKTDKVRGQERTPTKYPDRIVNRLVWEPTDVEEQNRLADEMVAWAQLPESIHIADFPLSKGMAPYRFYMLKNTNEYFAAQFNQAKELIGSKLFKGALNHTLNDSVAMKVLPIYDCQQQELMMMKAQTAAMQMAAAQVNIKVVEVGIPDFVGEKK